MMNLEHDARQFTLTKNALKISIIACIFYTGGNTHDTIKYYNARGTGQRTGKYP